MGSAGRGIDLKTNKGTGGYFTAAFFAFGLRSDKDSGAAGLWKWVYGVNSIGYGKDSIY